MVERIEGADDVPRSGGKRHLFEGRADMVHFVLVDAERAVLVDERIKARSRPAMSAH